MPKFIDAATREQVLALYAAGDSFVAIESKVSIPLSDVIKIVKGTYPRVDTPAEKDTRNPAIQPHHKRPAARALRLARWTHKRIAEHLDISPSSARNYTLDIQVPRRSPFQCDPEKVAERNMLMAEARQHRREGKTLAEIGRILRKTEGCISKWCKGVIKPIDAERALKIQTAREMRQRGDILKDIAEHLDMSYQYAHQITRDIPARKRTPSVPIPIRELMYRMKRSGARRAEIAKEFDLHPRTVSRILKAYQRENISDEILYTYNRDANGICYEVERHRILPDGEVEIEREPKRELL